MKRGHERISKCRPSRATTRSLLIYRRCGKVSTKDGFLSKESHAPPLSTERRALSAEYLPNRLQRFIFEANSTAGKKHFSRSEDFCSEKMRQGSVIKENQAQLPI